MNEPGPNLAKGRRSGAHRALPGQCAGVANAPTGVIGTGSSGAHGDQLAAALPLPVGPQTPLAPSRITRTFALAAEEED